MKDQTLREKLGAIVKKGCLVKMMGHDKCSDCNPKIDQLESLIASEVQKGKMEMMAEMKEYNDKLYQGDGWMLTNAFLDIFTEYLKQQLSLR